MIRGRPRVALLLASLIVVLHVACVGIAVASDNVFYMEYGGSRCPHYVPLHNFFESNFPSRTYFCDVDSNIRCASKFSRLVGMRLPPYIPTTLVSLPNNRTAIAIVIGEIGDVKFWNDVVAYGMGHSNRCQGACAPCW